MGSPIELVLCAGAIYGSYLTYGILQEGIFKFVDEDGAKFTFTLTLLLLQCFANLFGSIVGSVATGTTATKGVPSTAFLVPAFTFIAAMFCSNQALQYVSYPTQALSKSCKMVPVMLIQVLWFGKSYSFREYAMVVLVTSGVAIFQWKDKAQGADSAYGLMLLFGSLLCDGLTGPKQEDIMKTYQSTSYQIMFYCNMWAILFLGIGVVATNENLTGVYFILANADLVQKVVVFCVVSAIGQNFIFITLTKFNALILTTVTTTRKFFTILGSVMYYGHQLKNQQYFGIALVSAGLGLEMYTKFMKAQKKKVEAKKD
eukprot:m.34972 g.34972  ORF g.34972 m.34972 type:complete len:315 (-) comp17063_c0_seq1:505-1449(-)